MRSDRRRRLLLRALRPAVDLLQLRRHVYSHRSRLAHVRVRDGLSGWNDAARIVVLQRGNQSLYRKRRVATQRPSPLEEHPSGGHAPASLPRAESQALSEHHRSFDRAELRTRSCG